MARFKNDLKKFLNLKGIIILFIVLILSIIWFRYAASLILVAFFAPLSFFTVRYSKMVPHISIESFTSTSIFMGYIFGPGVGFVYGFTIGSASYIMNSFVSATYLSNPVLAGIAAIVAGTLKSLGFSFAHSFIAAIVVRTLIAFPWYGLLGTDPIERITHQTSQFFSNLILYLPLLSLLVDVVGPIVSQ